MNKVTLFISSVILLALTGCQSDNTGSSALEQPSPQKPAVEQQAQASDVNPKPDTAIEQQTATNAPATTVDLNADTIAKPIIHPVGTKLTWKAKGRWRSGVIVETVTSTTDTINGYPGVTYGYVYKNAPAKGKLGKFHTTFEGNSVQGWSHKGKLRTTNTPARKYLNFPLTPGKTWNASWQSTRHIRKNKWSASAIVTVIGWEQLQIPIGSIRVLKIVAKGQGNNRSTRTTWYSPKYGIVKSNFTSKRGSQNNVLVSLKAQ